MPENKSSRSQTGVGSRLHAARGMMLSFGRGDGHPRTHASFVDRIGRRRQPCVVEQPQGNSQDSGPGVDRVSQARPASWTEPVADAASAIRCSFESVEVAVDPDGLRKKARLCGKGAAGSALTRRTMADRDANGRPRAVGAQASASARCYVHVRPPEAEGFSASSSKTYDCTSSGQS